MQHHPLHTIFNFIYTHICEVSTGTTWPTCYLKDGFSFPPKSVLYRIALTVNLMNHIVIIRGLYSLAQTDLLNGQPLSQDEVFILDRRLSIFYEQLYKTFGSSKWNWMIAGQHRPSTTHLGNIILKRLVSAIPSVLGGGNMICKVEFIMKKQFRVLLGKRNVNDCTTDFPPERIWNMSWSLHDQQKENVTRLKRQGFVY